MNYEYAYEQKKKYKNDALLLQQQQHFKSKERHIESSIKTATPSPTTPILPVHQIKKINLSYCKNLTPLSLKLFLSMDSSMMTITHLDLRGVKSGSTQKYITDIVCLCSDTLTVLKVGFGLDAIKAPPSRKPWNMPTAQIGLSDRSLCKIVDSCRLLTTLVIHGCHQLRGTDLLQVSPPHSNLTTLDTSGCSALHMKGLLNILNMMPKVRNVNCSYTFITATTTSMISANGRYGLYKLAEKHLRTKPLVNEKERMKKEKVYEDRLKKTKNGRIQLQKMKLFSNNNQSSNHLKSIVGFHVDDKAENRGLWWHQHTIQSNACRVIQKGWSTWWLYTCEQRGAICIQKLKRGYDVRLRYWKKRDRMIQKQKEINARTLMQRMSRGYSGRKIATKRRLQVNKVNRLFAKQMVTKERYYLSLWKRRAYVQKKVRTLRKLIYERKRLKRMINSFNRWLRGIHRQVWAVINIQKLIRIYLAKREKRRKIAARRWDYRHVSMVIIQSWWRGTSCRFNLMVNRLQFMKPMINGDNMLNRVIHQFYGGVGWDPFDLGSPSKDSSSTDEDHSIIPIHFPTLYKNNVVTFITN
jgi:hypothetical protein